MSSKTNTRKLVLAAMFLALALLLPFLTGQLQSLGNALCPMHIPVLLCGFFCGPLYGVIVGFIAPLLRFALFGMPPIMPTGIAMCFELATYGLVAALLYRACGKTTWGVYVSLIGAMIAGRLVWGVARYVLAGLSGSEFGLQAFLGGAVLNAIPGIILHIVLIPIIVLALKRYTED